MAKIAKGMMKMMALLTAVVILQSCSAEDPISDMYSVNNTQQAATNGSSTMSGGSSELTTFAVEIDKQTAAPSTTTEYYPDDEDRLSANTFETEVHIVFNGSTATCDAVSGISIGADGAHLVADHGDTKGVCYVVSGSTDNGSLTIVGNKKYEVRLSGADITNPDSTALNLLSKKRAYVVMDKGTTNRLADGTTTKATDQKGALYCKGKLIFGGGGGLLDVYGNYNNAIHSADYIVIDEGSNIYAKSTANHGIKANDGVFINGGIVNVEVSAAGGKGINSESNITVGGGRTTVITSGTCAYDNGDATSAAAVKCDSTFTLNGGELLVKSTGAGGKGIKADWEAYINGGTLRVITTGRSFSYNGDSCSPKGIKVGTKGEHGLLNITGGNVMVRTSGSGGEGIESKGTITISNDASVQVSAYDDGINSAGDLYMMGGNIVTVGTNNDGIDSNGNMYISGGSLIAFGAGGAETGIDTGEQYKLYITGGQVFGIGGRIDASYATVSDAQPYGSTSGSVAANATVSVTDGQTVLAKFVMPPYSYNNGTIMVSAPGMQSGSSYTLNLGSSSLTINATTTSSSGMGGNMPGGNMPGGRW